MKRALETSGDCSSQLALTSPWLPDELWRRLDEQICAPDFIVNVQSFLAWYFCCRAHRRRYYSMTIGALATLGKLKCDHLERLMINSRAGYVYRLWSQWRQFLRWASLRAKLMVLLDNCATKLASFVKQHPTKNPFRCSQQLCLLADLKGILEIRETGSVAADSLAWLDRARLWIQPRYDWYLVLARASDGTRLSYPWRIEECAAHQSTDIGVGVSLSP
jgi:hypothetical protein